MAAAQRASDAHQTAARGVSARAEREEALQVELDAAMEDLRAVRAAADVAATRHAAAMNAAREEVDDIKRTAADAAAADLASAVHALKMEAAAEAARVAVGAQAEREAAVAAATEAAEGTGGSNPH